MNCSNCGTYNDPQSKVCIKCGNILNADNLNQPTELNQNINSQQSYQQPPQNQMQQPINQQPINNVQTIQSANVSTSPLNYLKYLITILLKPFQCYKEEESKLNNGKNSIILTLIITVIMTLLNLIQTIISTVRVVNYSWKLVRSYW